MKKILQLGRKLIKNKTQLYILVLTIFFLLDVFTRYSNAPVQQSNAQVGGSTPKLSTINGCSAGSPCVLAAGTSVTNPWQDLAGNVHVSGRVGIGTTTPSESLDATGYVKGQTGLCIGDVCKTSWPGGNQTIISGQNNGNYTEGSNIPVSFGMTFTTAPVVVVSAKGSFSAAVRDVSTTGFTVHIWTNGAGTADGFTWIAYGQ